MKMRILSAFLAVLFMLSSFAALGTLGVSAADDTVKNSSAEIQKKYVQDNVYATPEEKLASMTKVVTKYGYELYVDSTSGEIAFVESANRENVLFTNPYDVASSDATSGIDSNGKTIGVKEEILSQAVIRYTDVKKGQEAEMHSFAEAAMRGQIDSFKIRNGVRVEYTVGREETRKLVPRVIPAESFEKLIIEPMQAAVSSKEWNEFEFIKFKSYFTKYSLDTAKTDSERTRLKVDYPILEEIDAIYVLNSNASDSVISVLEGNIKDWCADTYSFEQMDLDHEKTGYVASDEEYPVFKFALEYTITEVGLSVRFSCNSLQYNMASYSLEDISLLPYMGAGNAINEGYNFYPDGSGSLFDYQTLKDNETFVMAKIYGLDYAYHEISGATYQKTIRMPVYGSVSSETLYTYNDLATGLSTTVSNTVKSYESLIKEGYLPSQITTNHYKRGYLAVIEEGESLGTLETYHAGVTSEYATIFNFFNPKPKDSYDVSDTISVSGNTTWTVVSDRKYTGNIKILYQLLTDPDKGEQIQTASRARGSSYSYYDASWLGMAEAYRNYLVNNGTLTKLESEDLVDSIPLYIETFGTLETLQTIATMPVNVMTPLTTFENVLTMYNELAEGGIKNINFKMNGYANGGMYATMPSSLKWERAVGGASGFRELIEEAKKIAQNDENANLGLYPDFDFAYNSNNELFDSLNLLKDAVKTIDNRYTSKRVYSATQQKYVSFYQLAISPSRYSKFYTKFLKNYAKYDISTLSVGTLGTALNSDFDEDDPYNREDSKKFTVEAFRDMQDAGYSLMSDGGNAYTWAYVDHLVNVDLDSSRYVSSSCSVPFVGAVLHGYIQFAGKPLNQEGDTDYAILKAIENGASMYFILSYQNTSELKKDALLSQNYSINYDIWKEDIVSYYNTLNGLLKDVQDKVIIDHEFLNNSDGFGTIRLPDTDELATQIQKELAAAAESARRELEEAEIEAIAKVASAMVGIRTASADMDDIKAQLVAQNATLKTAYTTLTDKCTALATATSEDEAFKAAADNVLIAYSKLEYLQNKLQKIYDSLDTNLEIVKDATFGTTREYQYTEAVSLVASAKANAVVDEELVNKTQLNLYKTFVTDATKTVEENVIALVTEALATPAMSNVTYTLADILADGVYVAPSEESETQSASTDFGTFLINNNRVVAVTYGDVDAKRNKTAFKTFILNYNNYTVRTVYDGVEYTIPAYGYVALYR